ncbi:MAG: HAD hydrolase-like protein [Campylobacterales bacterium]|nr:HAD hydrolase-like protein [Campylobacterales bacterium]
MIKNILWDFDGVILDSMKIKGDGFVALFDAYEKEKVKLLEEYHYANGGVSRFEKIKYFFNSILGQEISKEMIEEFAFKFATIIEQKLYDKSNLIEETLNFIENNYQKYNFHIVSGAEHDELNELCKYFELSKYFKSIDGSPTKKDILVKNILKKYEYKKEETVLIGDAMTDYNASAANEIKFYGFNNSDLKRFGNYIDRFEDLKL